MNSLMNCLFNTLKRGIYTGLRTTWELGKIVFPVTILVKILQHTPVLPWIIQLLTPLMKWIGLPGEAAIPLVLGNFLNIYAAIGAILSLSLSVKHVFILAMMLSFSHNIFIESSVATKLGVKFWIIVSVRLGLAMLSAVIINLLWHGGNEPAQYGLIASPNEVIGSWGQIFLNALQSASLGVLQIALIVIPIMIFIQILKDLSWLDIFSGWLSPATRFLGMKENTSMTLAAGLVFGLAYGAGVMLQSYREDGVSQRDMYLATVFLVSCHAVVEDTLIFLPLGIPVWPLLLVRLSIAIIITALVAYVWNLRDNKTYDKENMMF
jgi:hypothetical protein